MKVIIFHGTDGTSDSNWFPWLKSELEKLGQEVYIPRMPTPDNQSVETWRRAMREQLPFDFGRDTILVGHSIGATWIADILSHDLAEPIRAVFLVSGFADDIGNDWYDERNRTFTHYPFDWNLIRKNAEKIITLHGDDDPYVPIKLAENFAAKLGVEPIIVENGGHLNAESGYIKFPLLLDLIKEELK